MEESSEKRFIKRSVCVPLPTPGAPTNIILAARARVMLEKLCSRVAMSSWRGFFKRNMFTVSYRVVTGCVDQ